MKCQIIQWKFQYIICAFIIIYCLGCATTQDKRIPNRLQAFMSTKQHPEITDKNYRIYNAAGQSARLETILYEIGLVDVVFLGEMHNDRVGHHVQEIILSSVTDRYYRNAYASKRRQVVLSMEMFERDVQMILDEYLFDIIDEHHFLSCARPWINYQMNYHPLVQYSKKNNIKVIASNAPRRYVHRVANHGKQSLNDLSTIAKTWIAPLSYKNPSDRMIKQFQSFQKKALTQSFVHGKPSQQSNILAAQNLWDATMAFSINDELSNTPKALVIHLCGNYHTWFGIGIPEHLKAYRPDVKVLIISIIRDDQFPNFNPNHENSGDFVIITDPDIK